MAVVLSAFLIVPMVADAQKGRPSLEVFYDEAAFLAAVGDVRVEGFESFPTYDCTFGGPPESPTTLTTPNFTVTNEPTGPNGPAILCTGYGSDFIPVEGSNALIAGTLTGADAFTLTFTAAKENALYAVGFYLLGAAETGDAIFSANGEEVLIAPCCRPMANVLFFGAVSKKPLKTFQMWPTQPHDGWGIDQMSLAFTPRGR